MFGRRKDTAQPPADFFYNRLRQLVRDTVEPPVPAEAPLPEAEDHVPDAMVVLVELRAAARRGSEPVVSEALGPEFKRYISDFYSLEVELQVPCLEAIVESRRREVAGELDEAVAACARGLRLARDFLPLLARCINLQRARGAIPEAEAYSVRLLEALDRRGHERMVVELCRELVEQGIEELLLLETCGRRLEAAGESKLAARVWHEAALRLTRDGRYLDALGELDRALALAPNDPALYLHLAELYQRIEEPAQASAALAQAEELASESPESLTRVLLTRARVERPEEHSLGRLMDLLETNARERALALELCGQASAGAPHNPHLPYIHGVLLALDGQTAPALGQLKIAAERYSALGDRPGELDVRRSIQEIQPKDLDNRKRLAELLFELGDVKAAMEALGAMARLARREGVPESGRRREGVAP